MKKLTTDCGTCFWWDENYGCSNDFRNIKASGVCETYSNDDTVKRYIKNATDEKKDNTKS